MRNDDIFEDKIVITGKILSYHSGDTHREFLKYLTQNFRRVRVELDSANPAMHDALEHRLLDFATVKIEFTEGK